jgi:hypothetical protein
LIRSTHDSAAAARIGPFGRRSGQATIRTGKNYIDEVRDIVVKKTGIRSGFRPEVGGNLNGHQLPHVGVGRGRVFSELVRRLDYVPAT